MSHYFFHLGRTLDEEGVELANDDVARREAVRLTGEMLAFEDETFWDHEQWRVSVARTDGSVVCRLALVIERD